MPSHSCRTQQWSAFLSRFRAKPIVMRISCHMVKANHYAFVEYTIPQRLPNQSISLSYIFDFRLSWPSRGTPTTRPFHREICNRHFFRCYYRFALAFVFLALTCLALGNNFRFLLRRTSRTRNSIFH